MTMYERAAKRLCAQGPQRDPPPQYTLRQLPDEILILVLEYLSTRDTLNAARVCSRWSRLASRTALHIHERGDLRRVQPALRRLFLSARSLDIPAILNITRSLRTLITHERVPLDEDALKALQRLPLLKHLDVFPSSRRFDPSDTSLPPSLTTVVVNSTIVPGALKKLGASPHLTQLHMYGHAQYYPPREMTVFISARRDYLTELTLRCTELPDYTYVHIGLCPNLVVLRLYACWLMRMSGALSITLPRKLRVLHVTGARMLWTRHMKLFIDELSYLPLQELCLSGTCFGNEHTVALAERAGQLRILELWRTPVTSEAVTYLAHSLPLLQELDVDLPLQFNQLEGLCSHPSLVRLRCSRPPNDIQRYCQERSPPLTVCAVEARYGRGALRPAGDGWRSDLFYHWSVSHPLRPLPDSTPPPAFDDDSEDDYSLLDFDLPEPK